MKSALQQARRLQGSIAEAAVWASALLARRRVGLPSDPSSIFVLRNNDIGDLLVVTPLFEALRHRFPSAEIVAAIGRWNVPILKNNPYIDEVLVIAAPWFNKFIPRQSVMRRLAYLLGPEVRRIAARGFAIGIDVLGSRWGSLLMLRSGIPYRLGVRGYAGGHTTVHRYVLFRPDEHVGRAALRFAELLGAREVPCFRPQIFLDRAERNLGEHCWRSLFGNSEVPPPRLVIGPGGGLPAKCWPLDDYRRLIRLLTEHEDVAIVIAGGPGERESGELLAVCSPKAQSLAGHLSLRETFALVAAADLVICNSSMLMHVAAGFRKPTVVLLGGSFRSARQHQSQWGYPGTSWSLGKEEGGRTDLVTAEEAYRFTREILAARTRHPGVGA